ncbi:hypothetical protein FRB91_009258 [Serendipita sp. 411]|nr:hypothetical protein FRC18_012079 [Serendipita sp. 400]KAG8850273.1 hypothetical protein FRB91_009258 [Serendipita sp. 411]
MDFSWLDRSYVVDWALTLSWFLISGVFREFPVFKRDFSPDDRLISHKHRPNQVNGTMLHIISDAVPAVVVLIVAGLRRSILELHHGLLALTATACLQRLIVTFLKNLVGRLRPDFLDRCKWDGAQCTGKLELVLDGHRSFPSGHSSAAWAGMTFLFLYFADKTNCFRRKQLFAARSWRGSVLLRVSLTISPLFISTWVAITRLEDYRHHKEDIIVGSIIGFLSAYLMFRVYFPDPFARLSGHEAAGEPSMVYGSDTGARQDGFMELEQIIDERERVQEREGENNV